MLLPEPTALSIEIEQRLEPQKQFVKLFKRTVILLAGPTGSGKTEVSLKLASMIDGEIVSVDSMQVYQGMDIGTAKVPWEMRRVIPHHLIDVCHVQEPFNVVDFYYEAIHACQAIFARNKVPILVGGTGFYFHAFLAGPPQGPAGDVYVRSALEAHAEKVGLAALYEEVKSLDPQYALTITKNDRNKIIRALEIMRITGKRVSDHKWNDRPVCSSEYSCRAWFLSPHQEMLKQQLYIRCDKMLQEGLLEEVRNLLAQGIKHNPSAAKAIGYREWIEFIECGEPEDHYLEVKQKFFSNSWRYTKKQRTWFKRYSMFRELPTLGLTATSIAERIAEDYHLYG
ncbi:tRNA (adenosine(37)-N6)-dimethylallyltransferase MiaA [Chlamydia pecorum]|uniref:tRNA dimethylallyltransferase n=1 Tax=Chlamydia pecorum (strain ATCC VR-628 / DSM 29919 / E58) TaxID=331635 RepID=A0AA34RCE9_CHLPE|nr:tRNA (adenosine(37)-N6)-dimethylallyltransferase MiaA [Chlamydia pecorum]AEB41149.1 tRNA delta(2)-isopentenylpyrophosphate transferase [Chlamydia pecorum E58]AGW39211.1 tRNA delta(2)-isopentenylpyrophosphate transferase [Chlamydia pecorum W73]AGW40136.1 tRNA delta(2)-isopentenylpyrophosphate transferase [Chlamydia pecorum P787]ETF38505.1 tRNA delta(2)-isopentenylpyrophosphate transferase [Chlamydia pecorum VR629]ETF39010.1 tRNA delta(2)-isopentenylpyrophosphate transferase [Chlamydia pecoru